MPFSVACDDSLRHLPAKRRSAIPQTSGTSSRNPANTAFPMRCRRSLGVALSHRSAGSPSSAISRPPARVPSLRKMPYTVQKNVCITFGSHVRFALESARSSIPGCALARSGRNMISFSSALPWASCCSSRILSFVLEDTNYTRTARPKATRTMRSVAPGPYNCRKVGGGGNCLQ